MFRKTSLVAGATIVALSSAAFASPASAVTTNQGLIYSIDARVQYQMSKSDASVLNDLSGFGQDGELVGSGVKVTKKNRVFSFNGNGGYALSLDRHNFEDGITIEARVDLGKVDPWERIFDFATGEFESNNILLTRVGDTDNLSLHIYRDDHFGEPYGQIFTTDSPLKGKTGLHTFTFTVSVENEPSLFVDGVLSDTFDYYWDYPGYIQPFSVERSSSYVGISNWEAWGDQRLEGKIQYLRIYNYGLDMDTILEHATTNSKWDSIG